MLIERYLFIMKEKVKESLWYYENKL